MRAKKDSQKTIKINKNHNTVATLTGQLGAHLTRKFSTLHGNLTFIGELCYQSYKACLEPSRIRWKDTWRFIEIVGPGALPITALLGFLFGLILSFQGVLPLQQFGADIYIIPLVGTSIVRELAALMTAIIVIARTASAFAAEIGTMKINRELDALSTMGIDVVRFLILPRMLAVVLMMPLLAIYLTIFSFIGCYVVCASLGFSLNLFWTQMQQAITYVDIFNSLLKTVVFGFIIAGIGCLHGLRTQTAAVAVGNSTTKAVVSGIVMLTITDGIFAIIFYAVGI